MYEFSISENKFLILQIHALTIKIHFLNIISNIITEVLNIRKYSGVFSSINN